MLKLITVDGPSGVGKGTASRALAKHLGWKYLDSGKLYRFAAFTARQKNIPADDVEVLVDIINSSLDLDESHYNDVALRTEENGNFASQISAHPKVREALLQKQRSYLTPEGLVTDGRDMGTVIFPEAPLKFFLTADAAIRAERRFKELRSHGVHVNMASLLQEIKARDCRDQHREVAPLKPADDAIVIDTSHLSALEVQTKMLEAVAAVFKIV